MELSKKLLIYPLAITSLYLSPTEVHSQNSGGFVANYAVGNYTGGHKHGCNKHGCRNHRNNNVHLDTNKVKCLINSLEKLMLNKSEYCLYNPYKKHKCTGNVHLDTNKIKSLINPLKKLMLNKSEYCLNNPCKEHEYNGNVH